jgi:hypothetical protein
MVAREVAVGAWVACGAGAVVPSWRFGWPGEPPASEGGEDQVRGALETGPFLLPPQAKINTLLGAISRRVRYRARA